MPRNHKAGALAVAALAMAVIGCAPATRGAGAGAGMASAEPTTLIVENNNWSDINVYVLRSGSRIRLGTVTSITKRRFTLPAGLSTASGDLRLIADPIGSTRVYMSPPIQFSEGDAIIWRIENYLPMSSYMTRTGGVY